MMNFIPLSNLTDEELLRSVYLAQESRTPLELELAARYQHSLDELRKPRRSPFDIADAVVKGETTDGNGA